MENQPHYPAQLIKVADEYLASEIARIRQNLMTPLFSDCSLEDYCDVLIDYLKPILKVDRIYICNTENGNICAGWMKGRNMIKASDWGDEGYPLEMDETLQKALESDELIMNPVPGVGADLAVAIRFPQRSPWLMVFDETAIARRFSGRDLIYVYLARDFILLKAKH